MHKFCPAFFLSKAAFLAFSPIELFKRTGNKPVAGRK